MAKPNGDRDSGHCMEGVRGIFALLLLGLHSTARHLLACLQGVTTASLRGREVPGYPLDESWKDLGDALAMASRSAYGEMLIPPNIDPEGQYNVRLVDQLQAIQGLVENIDAGNAAADEADLEMLLAVAEVASLPRQIERDEANIMMVRRPEVLSSVAESGVAPSSLVVDPAVGDPQHLPPQSPVPETVAADAPAPDVAGILTGPVTGHLPQRIQVDEDKARAESQVEVEVAFEACPPGMLELITDVARPQFATPSMAVPGGDLGSNLEERMLVDHPAAGDSGEEKYPGDVENLEIEESHAKGLQ